MKECLEFGDTFCNSFLKHMYSRALWNQQILFNTFIIIIFSESCKTLDVLRLCGNSVVQIFVCKLTFI